MLTSIGEGRVAAQVDSAGAQLMSITLDGREYLWQGDERWWPRRAPILFPIVGGLRDGEATSAAGPCKMPRHGLARRYEHRIASQSDDSVTYELESTADTLSAYPFPFVLHTTYSVTGEASVETRFEVTNTGTQTMPFSVGGHPAFQIPAGQTTRDAFEDYMLVFSKAMTCTVPVIDEGGLLDFEHTKRLLDSQSMLEMNHRLFDDDAIVFTDVPDDTVTLVGRRSGRGVKMDFPGFRYLGVWSAANDAPFIALEPWTGCSTATTESDVFEEKRDITLLAPGETFERAFTITLL